MGSMSSRSVESVTDDDDNVDNDEDDDDDVMEVDLTKSAAADDLTLKQKQKQGNNKRLSIHLGSGVDARSKRERTGSICFLRWQQAYLHIAVNKI